MAITEFQRHLCRLLAETRIAPGESYLAGAVALNELRLALEGGEIRFHPGCIRGALPRVVDAE